MIHLSLDEDRLIVRADDGAFAPRHDSQLAYWGFRYESNEKAYVSRGDDLSYLVTKVAGYLNGAGMPCRFDDRIRALLEAHTEARSALETALASGRRLKAGTPDVQEARDFAEFLASGVRRPLKDHQYKAALHLLCTKNGANFSVPGSGKTAVVLAVFQRLRQLSQVDSLFVVGPPACFGPWRTEYQAVLGVLPKYEILAAGDIDTRHSKYLVNRDSACELYLTTFQTLHKDWEHVRQLFQVQGVRFYLVVDEAHYIKQVGGEWAEAVFNVAKHATRCCVLTGTPFPRSYSDSFNLFDVLWPAATPISAETRNQLQVCAQRQEFERATELLDESIGPLFYRVRKSDLGLQPNASTTRCGSP